jgi:hypothetical protein
MCDNVKSSGTTASEISKSMCCNCNINFTLTVNEFAEETKNCTKAQKLHAVEMKVHSSRKQKEPLLDIITEHKKHFMGPSREI